MRIQKGTSVPIYWYEVRVLSPSGSIERYERCSNARETKLRFAALRGPHTVVVRGHLGDERPHARSANGRAPWSLITESIADAPAPPAGTRREIADYWLRQHEARCARCSARPPEGCPRRFELSIEARSAGVR